MSEKLDGFLAATRDHATQVSPPMKMYTRATNDGDGTWTISGAKAWVSLAGEADIYFTVVKTSDAPGQKDMAMIAIPADAPGISFGSMYETP
ncbi:acyl-CoA dehydrogenase family protein [uncultured Roseobacter sp.]|uniref:acyl-CoA dehydrogenase family protein n=1 Tax=uncultured Roseobacter sp. TaxID=114847 RepID=UPI002614B207|nr:acyl-CoA dehydrogenase family protein [uncultured Roseobacter sp.]